MAPLTALLVFPAAAAVAVALLPERPGRSVIGATAVAGLLLAALLAGCFDSAQHGYQWIDEARWMPAIGAAYRVGVDGLSVLFLPATEILFAAVLLFDHGTRQREQAAMLLLLKAATLGIFVALDGLLFFLFWELALVLTYFLAARHGIGARAADAAMQYGLTLLMAGIPILLAFVIRATIDTSPDFDLRHWISHPPDTGTQQTIFLLLLAGLAFKIPLVPFHTWLPALAREGSPLLLATIVGLKLGAYAMIRLAIPLAPEAAQTFHWLIAALGTATLVFGALAALGQSNLRGLLAYASISHVGYVVLAVSSFSVDGVRGATMQLLNFSLASGVLFLLAGTLHRRLGTTEASQLGGLAGPMPLVAAFFVLFTLAGFGLPGTSGFPAELTMLFAVFDRYPGASLGALAAAVIGAAAALGMIRRVFFGPVTNPAVHGLRDLEPGETTAVVLLALLVLLIGALPQPLYDFLGTAARDWVVHLPRVD